MKKCLRSTHKEEGDHPSSVHVVLLLYLAVSNDHLHQDRPAERG
jgi:hypothetical protein